MKRFIPHCITLLNLLCGCIAAVYAFKDDVIVAGIFVAIGIFFDFFDGLVARMLKVTSELGKQLDSLADLITSGLVPGIVMCQLLAKATGNNSTVFSIDSDSIWNSGSPMVYLIAYIGFAITAASAYRLAQFNIDTRQSDSFIGLPTPANAIFIISMGVIAQSTSYTWVHDLLNNVYVLIGIIIMSCYILNANIALFALKFKYWGWAGNEIRWVFILICIVLIVSIKVYAIPFIIISYILLSLAQPMFKAVK